MVTLEQLEKGVITFVDKEIGQKAVGVKKFATYFFIPQIPKKIEEYFGKIKDDAMFQDFFDENKNIDIDVVYNNAKNAISKSGKFQFAGIILDDMDIDNLYQYIKEV